MNKIINKIMERYNYLDHVILNKGTSYNTWEKYIFERYLWK